MMTSRQSRDFLARVFFKYKSKITGDCCIFKFFRRSVDEKYLMCFQNENTVFKLLRCNMDRGPEPSVTTTTTMRFICMAIKETYSIAKAF